MWAAGLHLQPLSGVSGVQSFRHWLFLPRVSEDATRSPAATLTGRGLLSAQCAVLTRDQAKKGRSLSPKWVLTAESDFWLLTTQPMPYWRLFERSRDGIIFRYSHVYHVVADARRAMDLND